MHQNAPFRNRHSTPQTTFLDTVLPSLIRAPLFTFLNTPLQINIKYRVVVITISLVLAKSYKTEVKAAL